MQSANRFAFKEWAVICAALGSGRQSVILRKGGIHEGQADFRVEHQEFWLFPTNFHQTTEDLAQDYLEIWQNLRRNPPAEDRIPIRYYAIVEQAIEVTDASILPRLAGLHGWSDRVLEERFHYKRIGLFALLIRAYELPAEWQLPNSPHFAGCRSWVDLPDELGTDGLRPVLSDAEHAGRIDELSRRFAEVRIV